MSIGNRNATPRGLHGIFTTYERVIVCFVIYDHDTLTPSCLTGAWRDQRHALLFRPTPRDSTSTSSVSVFQFVKDNIYLLVYSRVGY